MLDPRLLALALLPWVIAGACAPRRVTPVAPAGASATVLPVSLIGDFVDDYDYRYTITAQEWRQLPRSRHHIVRVDAAGQYLVARNDSSNRTAPNKWMRIDWVALEGMAPYTWGYCYSTWQAPTEAAAETVKVVRRDTPRTGCNGYPFTRMRPAPPREPRPAGAPRDTSQS
jgi:hypothetical protein